MVVRFNFFLTFATLICRGTDISKCFKESLEIREIALLFRNISIYLTSGVKLHIHLLNKVVRFIVFLTSETLIFRGTDISKCFRESLGIRDNESRLYLFCFYFILFFFFFFFFFFFLQAATEVRQGLDKLKGTGLKIALSPLC